jgi:hypothetical protein
MRFWGAASVRVIQSSSSELSIWGRKMKRIIRGSTGAAWLASVILLTGVASAQQAPPSLRAGYNLEREVNLVGTVSNFVADSQTGPLGAHLMVQAAGGVVDVHVGTAEFLKARNLTLNTGDSVRIIGENFTNGAHTVFLARIVQKGTTAVAIRSPHGMPLWLAGSRGLKTGGEKGNGGVQ